MFYVLIVFIQLLNFIYIFGVQFENRSACGTEVFGLMGRQNKNERFQIETYGNELRFALGLPSIAGCLPC